MNKNERNKSTLVRKTDCEKAREAGSLRTSPSWLQQRMQWRIVETLRNQLEGVWRCLWDKSECHLKGNVMALSNFQTQELVIFLPSITVTVFTLLCVLWRWWWQFRSLNFYIKITHRFLVSWHHFQYLRCYYSLLGPVVVRDVYVFLSGIWCSILDWG